MAPGAGRSGAGAGEGGGGPPPGPGGDGPPPGGDGAGPGTDAGSKAPPAPPAPKPQAKRRIVGVTAAIAKHAENKMRVALVDGRDVYSEVLGRRLQKADFERLVVFGAACLGTDLKGLAAAATRIREEFAVFEEAPPPKKK